MSEPTPPDEFYAKSPCRDVADIQREEREKSMRGVVAAEMGDATGEWSSFRLQFRDAYAVKAPDGRYLVIPTGDLPRVVRELAAMMTEEQRVSLACALAEESRAAAGLKPGDCAVCGAKNGERCTPACDGEDGPGIQSPPVKSEPLAFLLEDLLADDA